MIYISVISREVCTTVSRRGQFETLQVANCLCHALPDGPHNLTPLSPQFPPTPSPCQESAPGSAAASSFFNFLECIICCCCGVSVAPLQGRHPPLPPPPASLKSILIKYPVSIRWCKSERPHQSAAAAALRLLPQPRRLKIQYLNQGILLGRSDFCRAATLLSGCFHLALRPSGEASLDFPALLFSRKGFISPCDTIYVSGPLFVSPHSLLFEPPVPPLPQVPSPLPLFTPPPPVRHPGWICEGWGGG